MEPLLDFIIKYPLIFAIVYLIIGILSYWVGCYFSHSTVHEQWIIVVWPLAVIVVLAVNIAERTKEGLELIFKPVSDVGWKIIEWRRRRK